MKNQDQERRAKRFIWKKSPVAKTIWVSYLVVLLLPLLLTVVVTTATVLRLQRENARQVESASMELSRLFSAYIEEIQANNSRILLSDTTQQLALINPDSFSTSDILNLRSLQKQLPKSAVASEYIKAIYVCLLRSGTMLSPGNVYYDYNAAFMLKDQLGLSLPAWKTLLTNTVSENVFLISGEYDQRPHLLIARRRTSHGGISDVVVVSEFKIEKAVRLMDEFSENGELRHTLLGADGAELSSSAAPSEAASWDELLLPIVDSGTETGMFLRTRSPKTRFLRQTMSLYWGFFVCALLFILFGGLLIRYFTRRQYSPIEQLNASLLASLGQNAPDAGRPESARNEYDQMTAAVTALLQSNASSRQENALLRENIRSHLLQGILFGNLRKEEIILRHAENNGIRFVGRRFLVILYAVEDMRHEDSSSLLMQNAEAISRLDEVLRTAISRLADNGSTRYAVEVEEKVACIISLPDALSEERIRKDVMANIQQVRDFFRDTFGVILTAAVSGIHSGAVSITTCFRECRETADYMELLGTDLPVCRYEDIPSFPEDALSFPELLEKEKKLCRNLSTGDYLSALAVWPEVTEALSLRRCPPSEARVRLLGVVNLMSSALSDPPPGMEDQVRSTFDTNVLQQQPDLDSMLSRIEKTLTGLAESVSRSGAAPENEKDIRFVTYVNDHITDPNLSISLIADHFDMSPSYFSRRFKKASGENLLDYIHRERLTLAKRIMAEKPESTLKEICEQVGYASPLTLNRAFRKYEGVTPSDYRSRLGE